MAWSTPPTFSDGAILSASQLNILSDNVEYLYSLLNRPNMPFVKGTLSAGGGATTAVYWGVWHVHRYLKYKIAVSGGNTDSMRMTYYANGAGGNLINDGIDRASGYVWEGSIDLDSVLSGVLAAQYGQLGEIMVEMVGQSPGGGGVHVLYLYESPV